MPNKIAVICPTRGRSDKIHEVLESHEKTSTCSDFYFVIDDDEIEDHKNTKGKFLIAPKGRRGMADSCNFGAINFAKEYDYIMFVGDDHRFRTEGWDERFLEAINKMGGWGLVYGNDLLQGAALPTAAMMSSNIIKTLGHFIWPKLQHLWIDNYWLSLCTGLEKITYLGDVIIEHMHYSVGKSEHDEAYAAVNNNPIIEHDSTEFRIWELSVRSIEIDLLKAAMEKNNESSNNRA